MFIPVFVHIFVPVYTCAYCIAERDCDFCECADELECRWKSVHAAKTLVTLFPTLCALGVFPHC